MNKSLNQYLITFTSDKPIIWVEWLPLCEFWFNTNYQTSTKFTPFEALYGIPPPKLLDYIPGITKVKAVDRQLRSRQQLLAILKHNLVQAQNSMKLQADQHQSNMVFEVGNWVYLRLQPYKQQSIEPLTSCLLDTLVLFKSSRRLELLHSGLSCLLSPRFIQYSMFLV